MRMKVAGSGNREVGRSGDREIGRSGDGNGPKLRSPALPLSRSPALPLCRSPALPLKVSLPRLDRRRPVASAPRAVAAFPDVGDAPALRRRTLAGEEQLQPVHDVVVRVQTPQVGESPQRVVLVLEYPH